jgi:DNA-binding response OmpR family regulator
VDDDRTIRIAFKRLLSRELSSEVIEAKDGLEGLCAIENEAPDLVLLDTLMPVMDGLTMLQAMRSSPMHTNIPVVSVSSVTDRSMILKLISLGIVDYIFKPIDWRDAKLRLKTVIRSVSRGDVEEQGAGFVAGGERETLLLIDKSSDFRGHARAVLERHFVVSEASTGVEGLEWIREHHPDVVCVAEGQALLNERMLAQTIRSMPPKRPAVYLLTDRPQIADEERQRYDGVVAKSFVPGLFFREVQRLKGSESIRATLRELFESKLRAELIASIQQTVGVMMVQGVRPLLQTEIEAIPKQVEGVVQLVDSDDGVAINVCLYGPQDDIVRLGSLAVGKELDFEYGLPEVFGEFLDTIGGRIQSSMEQKGLALEKSEPEVRVTPDPPSSAPGAIGMPFQCEEGERFVVLVEVQ